MIWNMVQTARTCVVTFKSSVDESVLYTVEVDAGSSVTYGGKTPTKSSTAQYTYTFSGWSRTKGGSAVSGILNDIEEDITLWSAFTSTVRKYTITWKNYDGTTLKTESVAYGTTPKWSGSMPTYAGFTAVGWNPTPKAVTGTATYTATYSMPNGMNETIFKSWDTIIADSAANRTSGYSTGGTKIMLLTDNSPLCYELAGINLDSAGHFAFITRTTAGNTKWKNGTTESGYRSSTYKLTYLEKTILDKFPSNIKNALKTVTKYAFSNKYPYGETEFTASIWAPNIREMNANTTMYETSGPCYTYYSENSKRIRYDASGEAVYAWLSSCSTSDIRNVIAITSGGGCTLATYSHEYGALPCFVL